MEYILTCLALFCSAAFLLGTNFTLGLLDSLSNFSWNLPRMSPNNFDQLWDKRNNARTTTYRL